MKKALLILITCLLSGSAFAQTAFDPAFRGNLRTTVEKKETGSPENWHWLYLKADVGAMGAQEPITVEWFYTRLSQSGTTETLSLATAQRADRPGGTFRIDRQMPAQITGWFVRVVQAGRIVGLAGSSPETEKIAAVPIEAKKRPGETAQPVLAGYDPASRENVTTSATVTSSGTQDGLPVRGLRVTTSSLGTSESFTMEAVIVLKGGAGDEFFSFGSRASVSPGESVDFKFLGKEKNKKVLGWFVRLVRGGKIVGVAGSTREYELAAGNPSIRLRPL